MSIHQHSGSKYLRKIRPADGKGQPILIDVYQVCEAFETISTPIDHCLKKLLMAGLRGKGSVLQDLKEAKDALSRGIEIQQDREQEETDRIKAKEALSPKEDNRPPYLREAIQKNMGPAEDKA